VGRRYAQDKMRRGNNDPTEIVVIDYADGQTGGADPVQIKDGDLNGRGEVSITGHHPALYFHHPTYGQDAPAVHGVLHYQDRQYRAFDAVSSDTSSAYSGSDTMQSIQSGTEEVDLSGLHESVVDSDEEDLAESIDSLTLRDTVRDCLEKDPADRTEEDIEIILEFTHSLEAFADMSEAVRRAMCYVMVFAVVDKEGTVVMNDGEELDSWSVIINGAVRVDGESHYTLSLGQGFGITPTMSKMYHTGVMTTVVDDCQFVCITQTDYYKILHDGDAALVKEEVLGEVVKVSEVRRVEGGGRHAQILLRATPEKLLDQLVEDTSAADPTFIEDFLLCHRIFLDSSIEVVRQLMEWFEQPSLRDRVTRILLLWVNNHFTDFELDSEMMKVLEAFEAKLEVAKMQGQLRMLNFACAAKARARTVTITRSSRDEVLEFKLTGGYQRAFGIFIESVDKGSKAARLGLKRGDEILDVNGDNFKQVMTLERALTLLQNQTHLQINVKSNLLAFKEVINSPETAGRSRNRKTSDMSFVVGRGVAPTNQSSLPHLPTVGSDEKDLGFKRQSRIEPVLTTGGPTSTRDKLKRRLLGLLKPKVYSEMGDLEALYTSEYEDDQYLQDNIPEHSLKIYRCDQTYKYLLVNKNTTAREVVMLSLKEFGMTDCSTHYTLCEVGCELGFVRQKRLAESTCNLAQRIGLASRYYIKNISNSQQLVPEELSSELQRESVVGLLQLNPVETATQLMVEDFTIFRQIEQTEYVDFLFKLESKFGMANLTTFSLLVNKETLWVVTELCSEHNLNKRVKMAKHFLKIAKQCKEAQNFNSMFAITSGLTHTAVVRLKQTWERVPEKYKKLLNDLTLIMDPSRNFSRYRNMLKSDSVKPPIIPIYPMVAKDLTFIDIGNQTKKEGLVNFEKLRLVAKEIRSLTSMCSAPLRNVPDNIIAMNEGRQQGMATMRRKGKPRDVPDARKMYSEALMVRKVKAYLANIDVNEDEEVLHRMSVEVEPPPTKTITHMGSTPSLKSVGSGGGKPPSPSPSRVSSTFSEGKKSISSNQPSKFGANSPEAVRKLMSLSEPNKGRKLPKHQSKSSYNISPGPSPLALRRGAAAGHGVMGLKTSLSAPSKEKTHERSHSDTPVIPVNLTAESSSVASLPGIRRGSVSSQRGSVSSQEDETDGGNRFSMPHEARRDSTQALTRKVSSVSCGGSSMGPPLELPPRAVSGQPPPRPPDYQTTLGRMDGQYHRRAQHRRNTKHRVSRTQSREADVSPEDERQVSAV